MCNNIQQQIMHMKREKEGRLTSGPSCRRRGWLGVVVVDGGVGTRSAGKAGARAVREGAIGRVGRQWAHGAVREGVGGCAGRRRTRERWVITRVWNWISR
jgi:hypothetical protein